MVYMHISTHDRVCARVCVRVGGREKSLGQVGRMRRDQGVYLFVKIEAACAPKAAPPACDLSALDPVVGLPLPSPGDPECWLPRLLTARSEGLKVLPQG